MKIELTIDRMKKLPDGAIPALESELLKRLSKQFDECQLTIKRATNDGLTVFGGRQERGRTYRAGDLGKRGRVVLLIA
ncbi:DinI-like family protein [Enterobacter asburiae]|nr:DinI-like family protein [Enterobacter asburiae]MCK7285406.1 DinI-like family protein [Enterobacter asburiae]